MKINFSKIFKHRTVQTIHCIGDSHMSVFNHPSLRKAFRNVNFVTTIAEGATASGLENPNPISNSTQIFEQAEESIKKSSAVIICLGEVDTGFVIWWRAEKREIGIEAALSQAIERYESFILKYSKLAKCVVMSTPLPSIADGAQFGIVANARKEISANQKQRTLLTLRFNQAIYNFCIIHGIAYLNLDNDLLDNSTGTVRKKYLNKDSKDHHYNPEQYSRLIKKHLKYIIKLLRQSQTDILT